MRWLRYEGPNGIRYGLLDGTTIEEIDGTPFGGWRRTGATADLHAVKTLVPVIPGTFYAIGANYRAHAAEVAGSSANVPGKPNPGYRANSALIADGENIVIPRDSSELEYEGELVAVIGKTCRRVPEADALAVVFGYTIGNDVSERNWQNADRGLWRAKNSDTFKPMGPWIETNVDLPRLTTRIRLNGAQQCEFRTNDMIFGVERYVAEISKYITLSPGDVIWMGTDAPAPMHAGDVVEIEIDQIGTLRNPVIAEDR